MEIQRFVVLTDHAQIGPAATQIEPVAAENRCARPPGSMTSAHADCVTVRVSPLTVTTPVRVSAPKFGVME